MSKNDRMVGISRRTLVKSTAIGSLVLAEAVFLYRSPCECSGNGTTGQRKSDLGACCSTVVAAVHFVYMLKIMK